MPQIKHSLANQSPDTTFLVDQPGFKPMPLQYKPGALKHYTKGSRNKSFVKSCCTPLPGTPFDGKGIIQVKRSNRGLQGSPNLSQTCTLKLI